MVVEAIWLGAIAQVSLLLSGLFATWVTVPARLVGWLGAFGAGALISAVAFDLTPQAEALGGAGLALWLLLGAALFIGGDYAVDRRLGSGGSGGGADGGVLAMLTNSLMPFAFQRGGQLAGLWTVVGFALAVLPR